MRFWPCVKNLNMSFYTSARRVRETDLPPSHRLSAFRSCIQLYHCLIKQPFTKTFARYEECFGLKTSESTFNEQINQAMNALETERRLFLERLYRFEKYRI